MRKNEHKRRRPLSTPELQDAYERGIILRLDQRSAVAKRLRQAYETIIRELGGPDQVTEVKLGLIEEYVFQREFQRAIALKIVDDPVGNADLVSRWTQQNNALSGLATKIGLKKETASQDDFDALEALNYEGETVGA